MSQKVKRNLFTVNFVNETIEGTQNAFDLARKGSGEAYKQFLKLREENPTYKAKVIIPESHLDRAKISYHGLKEEFIIRYLNTKDNRNELMLWLENTKKEAMALQKKRTFAYVKSCFIDKFGEIDKDGLVDKAGNPIKHFDMEKANAEIKAYEVSLSNNAEVMNASAKVKTFNTTETIKKAVNE